MINSNDNNSSIDERALEALLVAAFRLNFPEELSDEQAEILFQQPARLSQEDKATTNSWGTDFIADLFKGRKTELNERKQNIEINQELEQEIYAMNRDKNSNNIDEETLRKIVEERKKAIEEENNKKEDNLNNEF